MLTHSWGHSKVTHVLTHAPPACQNFIILLSPHCIFTHHHIEHSCKHTYLHQVLELTMADYIKALAAANSDNNINSGSVTATTNSSSSSMNRTELLLSNAAAGLRHSAAPLRNMAKDMQCVVGELSAEELGPGLDKGATGRLPVLTASHEAIQRACSQEVSQSYIYIHSD